MRNAFRFKSNLPTMKNILQTLIILTSLSTHLLGQTTSIKVNGNPIQTIDTTFLYSDTIQSIFLNNNGPIIWNLRSDIRSFNFDHCNHQIELLVYLDTTSEIKHIQLITGTSLEKIDSQIISRTQMLSGKLSIVNFNKNKMRAIIFLRFQYFSRYVESNMLQTFPKYGSRFFVKDGKMSMTTLIGKQGPNECADDLFFYNEGLKFFNQNDFSKAIYNFTQALEANPRDMEANYNLGLAYQKSDKVKKACKCFSEGAQVGDENSTKALSKYCADLNSK